MELKNILSSTRVDELTISSRPSLSPVDTINAAANAMREVSHGSCLICDGGKLVGILTERDLLHALSSGTDFDSPVSTVMTENPQTITANDSLLEAARMMDRGGYRRLPVIDENENAVGFIDVKNLMHFLVEHFPSAVYNQASLEDSIAKKAEGA